MDTASLDDRRSKNQRSTSRLKPTAKPFMSTAAKQGKANDYETGSSFASHLGMGKQYLEPENQRKENDVATTPVNRATDYHVYLQTYGTQGFVGSLSQAPTGGVFVILR